MRRPVFYPTAKILDGDCWKFGFLFRCTILKFSGKYNLYLDGMFSTKGATIQTQEENTHNFIQEQEKFAQ